MTILNDKKLRHSQARERIFEHIIASSYHPSAEDIYDALKSENPNLSLGTVYRNLKQLEELGRIVRVTSVNDRERYDAFCENHVHFVCMDCGRVIDAREVDLGLALSACRLSGDKRVDKISILLSGRCESCGKKS